MSSTMNVISTETAVLDITPVLDANAYADNDVLFVPIVVPGAFREAGSTRVLQSVVVLDGDDQAIDMDLVFLNATATLGTINSAVSISDADAAKIIGYVRLTAADDANDLINSYVYAKSGIGQVLKAASGQTDLYVAGIVRSGTPTFTASGMKIKLGFI